MPNGLSTGPGQDYIEIKLQSLPKLEITAHLRQFNIRPLLIHHYDYLQPTTLQTC